MEKPARGRPAKGQRLTTSVLVTPEDETVLRAVAEVLGVSMAEATSGLILAGLQRPETERLAALDEMRCLPSQLLVTRSPTAIHSVIRSLGDSLGGVPITLMGGTLIRLGLQNLGPDLREHVTGAAEIALDPAAAEDLVSKHLGGMQLAI